MTHAASLCSMGMLFLWFGNLPMCSSPFNSLKSACYFGLDRRMSPLFHTVCITAVCDEILFMNKNETISFADFEDLCLFQPITSRMEYDAFFVNKNYMKLTVRTIRRRRTETWWNIARGASVLQKAIEQHTETRHDWANKVPALYSFPASPQIWRLSLWININKKSKFKSLQLVVVH